MKGVVETVVALLIGSEHIGRRQFLAIGAVVVLEQCIPRIWECVLEIVILLVFAEVVQSVAAVRSDSSPHCISEAHGLGMIVEYIAALLWLHTGLSLTS